MNTENIGQLSTTGTLYRSDLNSNGSNSLPFSEGEHDNSSLDFWKILNAIKKWWWLVFLIAAAVTTIVSLIVFRMTPIYETASVLEIKQQERKILNDSDVDSIVADKEFFDTQIELLKSQSLASNVIDSLNLMSDAYFYAPDKHGVLSIQHKKRHVIKQFERHINISPVGRSRLIRVSFEHPNAAQAARISNTVTDTFISYNMERKYNATSYARDFLEKRLTLTKEILETSERDLVAYAEKHHLVTIRDQEGAPIPGLLGSNALIKLDAELTQARTDLLEAEQNYNLAVQNVDIAQVQNAPTIIELKKELVALNSEYMEKQARFKPEFPAMRELQSRIGFLNRQINAETQSIRNSVNSELEMKYKIALSRENNLRQRVAALKANASSIRIKSVDYNILQREVETNRSQYDALLQRLKEVSISDEIGSNLISLVDEAQIPAKPVKPNKLLSLILAMIAGTLLGTSIAFLIELIDDRVKTPEDVKKKLKSIVMGVIPVIKNVSDVAGTLSDSQSGTAEAYASLRTNLQFSGPNGGPQIIHITSTRSGEGKSVSALGLALRFSGLNEKVLLIDADMRLPTFLKGDGTSIGLSGLLTSSAKPEDHIQSTRHANLHLLPSGNLVPNPSEILSTYRLNEILDYTRQHFDRVIVDSPPVMGIADAPILAARCDASILLVECAGMRTAGIKTAIERLSVSGAKLLGVVLSKYKAPSRGYMNYYQYSYGATNNSESLRKKGKKSKAAKKKQYLDII